MAGLFLKTPRHFFCLLASPVSLPPARGFSSFRMRVKVRF
ncbi:hypothetical protein M107_0521 [Bacteroides fragilis str. 3725 D9(v)]|nr:hypothetical protein M107_0521 [Bacteroides fragilis str. 3725 D9(v)]